MAIWDNLQCHNTRLPLGHTTILTDMRYHNRHVDTHVMGGSNCDVGFVIAWIFT